MTEILPDNIPADALLSLALVAVVLLLALAGALGLRVLRRRRRSVERVIRAVAFDYLSDLVIPKADEGEIHLDHLLLTAEGLLVLDVKDVHGIVFGGDKLQDWTVIAKDRRYTFSNPQPALYDRIAAVRQIVRQVPVDGRVLFLDGAEFRKGTPEMVCTLDDLEALGNADATVAAAKIDAFKPHWDQVRRAARG